MVKNKILDWLEKKYDDSPYIDYKALLEKMLDIHEDNDNDDLDYESLHKEAIDELNDDGGMFPNGIDD